MGSKRNELASKHLIEARAALEDGDDEAALSCLLEAWRCAPAPAIADVVDVLSKKLTATTEPIRAVGSTSATKAWHALADSHRPGALGRLLEALPEGNDRCARLEKVIAMDRDPRITSFARTWLVAPPVHGARRVPFFTKLIALLDETRDVRLLSLLEELTSSARRSRTIHQVGLKSWKPLVALAKALASTKVPELDGEDATTLADIEARLSSTAATTSAASDPASLFAKVYAAPSDDEARAVLSDLLQQNGDPRGEFIALQLARHGTNEPPSARERALEAKWAREWLGAIAPVVLKGDVVFERGFVTRCRYAGGSKNTTTLAAEEWSTVVHLDVSTASRYVGGSWDLLVRPAPRRSLRHVLGLGHEDIENLARAAALPWETLGMRIWRWAETRSLLAGPGQAFPHVKKLVVSHAESGIIGDATTRGIEEVIDRWPDVVELDVQVSASLIAELARSTSTRRLPILTARSGSVAYVIDRNARDLRVSFGTFNAYNARHAAETLDGLVTVADVDRVTVLVGGRVTRVGDTLTRGRENVSLAPLRASADAAALPFDLVVE